jgi:serine/threonine-protein kinase
VDDEAPILSALRRCLRREGYQITTADSPLAALELLRDHEVDAVLSDHKMPGMDGLEFLAEVRRRQPQAALLMISGWSEAVPRSELEAIGVLALLPKPWEDAELKRVLRAALSGGAERAAAPANTAALR